MTGKSCFYCNYWRPPKRRLEQFERPGLVSTYGECNLPREQPLGPVVMSGNVDDAGLYTRNDFYCAGFVQLQPATNTKLGSEKVQKII